MRGSLLDYAYFEKNYKLIAANISKQSALDADPRAIQQILFTGEVKKVSNILYSLTIKRNSLRILQRNNKSFLRIYKWLNTIK